MLVKVFNVYKGVPVEVNVRAERFWNYKQLIPVNTDSEVSVTLVAYEGLETAFDTETKVLTVSGTLPDYSLLGQKTGVLMPYGETYLANDGGKFRGLLASGVGFSGQETSYNLFYFNGNIVLDTAAEKSGWLWVGTCTIAAHEKPLFYCLKYSEYGAISYEGRVVSGFNTGNYLVSSMNMPTLEFFGASLRFISRVVSGSSVSGSQNLFWDEGSYNHGFGISSSKWRIWNGTAYTGGTVSANTAYWVMFIQQAEGGSKLYYLVDDGSYTEQTLPMDVSAWTLAVSVVGTLFNPAGGKIRIGTGYTSASEYWKGKIDLGVTRVDSGGMATPEGDVVWNVYWRAMVE